MKKKQFLFFASMLCISFAYAQFNIGIKGGWTLSSFRESKNQYQGVSHNAVDASSHVHIGLVGDWKLAKHLWLQPQLLYTVKGTGLDAGSFGGTWSPYIDSTLRLSYVELPVNLVYKIKKKHFSIFFGAGGYMAMGLSSKLTIDGKKKNTGSYKNNQLKPFDAGISATAGFQLNNGIFIAGIFQEGLTNISNDIHRNLKNADVLQLSIGYYFNQGKKKK